MVNILLSKLPFRRIIEEFILQSVQEAIACTSDDVDVFSTPASASEPITLLESNVQKIMFGVSGAGDHFLTMGLERKTKSPL